MLCSSGNDCIIFFCYFSKWSENIITDASQLLAEDLPLAPGAPGGQVQFRQSLATSFFFKFYLNVSECLTNQAKVTYRNFFSSGFLNK